MRLTQNALFCSESRVLGVKILPLPTIPEERGTNWNSEIRNARSGNFPTQTSFLGRSGCPIKRLSVAGLPLREFRSLYLVEFTPPFAV